MKGEDIKEAVILLVVITAAIVIAGMVAKKLESHFENLEA